MIHVSVVTPTFQRASFLPRVWASLVEQEITFEWVVVDDGSTDETAEVINGIEDQRIVYIRLSENKGVNVARNKGAQAARGRYVVFLDSDDELVANNSLAKMVNALDQVEQTIGVALFACVRAGTGEKISRLVDGRILNEYDIVCNGALRGGDCIYVYRREIFDSVSLPEDLRGCEQVFVYALSKEWRFIMVDIPLSIVHYQGDNLSSSSSLIARSRDIGISYERLIAQHANVLLNNSSRRQYMQRLALYRYAVAGATQDMLKLYKSILAESPPWHVRLIATAIVISRYKIAKSFESWRIERHYKRLDHLKRTSAAP